MFHISLKAKLHIFVRLKTCPFTAIIKYLPEEGDIYELGCGYGIFFNFLPGISNGKRRFIGFDIDEKKINFARENNKNQYFSFEVQDITQELKLVNAACILLIDALTFIPFSAQEKLLHRCFNYLSEKGMLIIKDVDTRPFWKYAWNQFQETLVLKVFKLIRGQGPHCRSRHDYLSLLKNLGYRVNIVDIHRGYLYPHVLYICHKS